MLGEAINRKHEMFWNQAVATAKQNVLKINRKHEMFWNHFWYNTTKIPIKLTVNMKCFEIQSLL